MAAYPNNVTYDAQRRDFVWRIFVGLTYRAGVDGGGAEEVEVVVVVVFTSENRGGSAQHATRAIQATDR